MCEAPTPYIIGLMRSSKANLFKYDISDVFVIDLDKHKILKDDTDGINILPDLIINWIKQDLQKLLRSVKTFSGNDRLDSNEDFILIFV